jgi:hypothetical protein
MTYILQIISFLLIGRLQTIYADMHVTICCCLFVLARCSQQRLSALGATPALAVQTAATTAATATAAGSKQQCTSSSTATSTTGTASDASGTATNNSGAKCRVRLRQRRPHSTATHYSSTATTSHHGAGTDMITTIILRKTCVV